jgi:hypothetical protein
LSGATVTIRDADGVSEELHLRDSFDVEPEERGVLLHYRYDDIFVPWTSVVRIDYVGRRPEHLGRPA